MDPLRELSDLVPYGKILIVARSTPVERGGVSTEASFECTTCFEDGSQSRLVKDTRVRSWVCPECGYEVSFAVASQLVAKATQAIQYLDESVTAKRSFSWGWLMFWRAWTRQSSKKLLR